MVRYKFPLLFLTLLFTTIFSLGQDKFTIAFGSCNNQNLPNPFWQDIISLQPNVWIWGGDNIYADTHNMHKMKKLYNQQKNHFLYKKLIKTTPVLATWDDHDYGKNDGGTEYKKKKESQQLFLDFLDIPINSPRRKQEGIYHSKTFNINNNSIKIIVLDSRYFRTGLTKGIGSKRFQSNTHDKGSILGTQQWKWLESELKNSNSSFNIIVSSIQILSKEHGFEKWGNFPNEVTKLFKLIKTSKAKNIIFLSGDRHISEFSKTTLKNIPYPIIDFTSSGLTHSYNSFKNEQNKFRVGEVISSLSFGILHIDLTNNKVTFQMRGKNNTILQEINQKYP
ncbi:alkaline phosphatase D family protein [Tenacibaculum sp. nBUS_03]|uniref:alkaline phosphatase D family protein n=1 Tax=Tenacibaculum sp. nBUS_03 TaxID=3395320 RepID=UPI003EBE907B